MEAEIGLQHTVRLFLDRYAREAGLIAVEKIN
jgi:hypothetical protein